MTDADEVRVLQLTLHEMLVGHLAAPELSPAYDIVTTRVYIEGESSYALNIGKTRDWYKVTYAHFQSRANKAAIPWQAIKPHLDDTMARARAL